MQNPQLLKGVLDGCVLKIIHRKEIYGYDLIKELQDEGFVDIKGGTVYPLLQKLEKQDLIRSQTKPSPEGPDRKYFTITAEGEKHLENFKKQWEKLTQIVAHILQGENTDD